MNEQQLAELKRIKTILSAVTGLEDDDQEYIEDARKALQSIISQDALDKKAENARELGLSYDDEPKIGCVNHDCDKCKAVQDPVAWGNLANWCLDSDRVLITDKTEAEKYHRDVYDLTPLYATPPIVATPLAVQEPVGEVSHHHWRQGLLYRDLQPGTNLYTTPPAPQPVPVKTYHDGKPWPVAPKPWVGLTDAEIMQTMSGDWTSQFYFVRAIEAKLKEKNAALPPMHASGLVAIKTLLERDPEAHAALVIDMIDEMLGENT